MGKRDTGIVVPVVICNDPIVLAQLSGSAVLQDSWFEKISIRYLSLNDKVAKK